MKIIAKENDINYTLQTLR